MTIGWIGAGKVGFSLGRYLSDHGVSVAGYYSKSPTSAAEAAKFTGTRSYSKIEDLVRDSDIIFLTVPDDAIVSVWEQLRGMKITGKCICHCSGVLSSEIFSDIHTCGAYGCSIHPLLAVNDKLHSYKELSNALFTIEGDEPFCQKMADCFRSCGNTVTFVEPGDKVRYHAAAVFASNLVLGLAETAIEELTACGFGREEAKAALVPFMMANISHLSDCPIEGCLTGPVERGDIHTVQKHLERLEGTNCEIYRLLSQKALGIAKRKNPLRAYDKIQEVLE